MIDRRSRFVFFCFFFARVERSKCYGGCHSSFLFSLRVLHSTCGLLVPLCLSARLCLAFFLRLSQICCSSLGLCLTLVRFFSSCSSSSFGRINAEVSQSVSFCISDQKVVSSNAETGRTPSTTWISFFLIWTIKTPHQVTLERNVCCCCCCCSSHLDSLGLLWSEQRGSGSHLKTV